MKSEFRSCSSLKVWNLQQVLLNECSGNSWKGPSSWHRASGRGGIILTDELLFFLFFYFWAVILSKAALWSLHTSFFMPLNLIRTWQATSSRASEQGVLNELNPSAGAPWAAEAQKEKNKIKRTQLLNWSAGFLHPPQSHPSGSHQNAAPETEEGEGPLAQSEDKDWVFHVCLFVCLPWKELEIEIHGRSPTFNLWAFPLRKFASGNQTGTS